MDTTNFRSLDALPLTLTVDETARVLRIGRNSAYALVRCGAIRSLRIGKQLRVPKAAIAEYLGLAS